MPSPKENIQRTGRGQRDCAARAEVVLLESGPIRYSIDSLARTFKTFHFIGVKGRSGLLEVNHQFMRYIMASKQSSLWSILVIMFCSVNTTGAQENVAAGEAYEVQPGDVLFISVWKEPELQKEVLMRPDGAFTFPLAGEIAARDKTVEDLRIELTSRLSRYIPDIVVTVSVTQINGNKVYVIGQVNDPGEFIVNPRVDVMQALSMAGGTTPFADLKNIRILRRSDGKQTALEFRYDDVIRGRRLEQNIVLESGDVVVVP